MTQDEIIRMATAAGFNVTSERAIRGFCGFAALVATNEREKQAEQEPVGYFAYDEEHDIWEELTSPDAPGATPLYADPVRTKDLSDNENGEWERLHGYID